MTGLMDEGRAVNIVLPFFSKAFHTVPHKIFTEALLKYGLDKQAMRWTEKWLCRQTQRVVVSGMVYLEASNKCSTPWVSTGYSPV